jgi:hypothetical protein
LQTAREIAGHPVLKGDAAEAVWLGMLSDYLPKRYHARRAVVVDSNGRFSEQIDIVVLDRQYSPFVFHQDGLDVVPAESVYAVFEAKQVVTADEIRYAQNKAASVRVLHRTSLPIPHATGIADPKMPQPILAGLVTLESDWKPPLGDSLTRNLGARQDAYALDLGCVAAHGMYARGDDGGYQVEETEMAATAFLFELIARLQALATVPMIDIRAYAMWLRKA